MMGLISIAAGGAVGALMRFWVAGLFNLSGYKIPFGTLLCNVAGSFLMGVLFVVIVERSLLPESLRPLLMTGMLGAFTTFSTFSLETVSLLHDGFYTQAMIYLLSSVLLSIFALYGGIVLARVF